MVISIDFFCIFRKRVRKVMNGSKFFFLFGKGDKKQYILDPVSWFVEILVPLDIKIELDKRRMYQTSMYPI